MADRIHDLATIWRKMISQDHHKHRDGYFEITISWDYDKPARYAARHSGYLTKEYRGPERGSLDVARQDLEKHLLECIRDHYKWAKEVLDEDDEEREWNGQQAEHIVNVVTENLHILKGENE